jgi:hypothetical protein
MLKNELIKKNKGLNRENRRLTKELEAAQKANLSVFAQKPITQDKKDELIESYKAAHIDDKKSVTRLEKENLHLTEKYKETLISKNGAIEATEEHRVHSKKMIGDFKLNVAKFIAEGWWTRVFMTKEEIEEELLNDINIYEKFS